MIQRWRHQTGRYALLIKTPGLMKGNVRIAPYDPDKTAQQQWDEGFSPEELAKLAALSEQAEDYGIRAGTWGLVE